MAERPRHSAIPAVRLALKVIWLAGDRCLFKWLGVAEATFYRWKRVYAGMGVSEIRRLKQLEEENTQLKRLVTDFTPDKTMLQDALRKKW